MAYLGKKKSFLSYQLWWGVRNKVWPSPTLSENPYNFFRAPQCHWSRVTSVQLCHSLIPSCLKWHHQNTISTYSLISHRHELQAVPRSMQRFTASSEGEGFSQPLSPISLAAASAWCSPFETLYLRAWNQHSEENIQCYVSTSHGTSV